MAERIFRDRAEAGRELARKLASFAGRPDLVILALPRGGVPVAAAVADALHAPLDVFVVRKLGVPGYEELAMGAIASGGVRVLNDEIVASLKVPAYLIEQVTAQEREELQRRERVYRGGRAPAEVRGRTVILVDDGLATGASMQAAIRAIRQRAPKEVVVAVPTASRDTVERLKHEADAVICADLPEPFWAVGAAYRDFTQTSDDEVRRLLGRAQASGAADPAAARAAEDEPDAAILLRLREAAIPWMAAPTTTIPAGADRRRAVRAARRSFARNARILPGTGGDHPAADHGQRVRGRGHRGRLARCLAGEPLCPRRQ
ncbi:phosphoribosyltransferase [Methylobacterium oryzae CBMB20]